MRKTGFVAVGLIVSAIVAVLFYSNVIPNFTLALSDTWHGGSELVKNLVVNSLESTTGWPWTRGATIGIIVAIGILAGLLASTAKRWIGLLLAIVLALVYLGALLFLSKKGVALDAVHPLISLFAAYLAGTWYRSIVDKSERRKAVEGFKSHVSESSLNEMVKAPEKLRLGGEKKEVTVLFSDARGFSAMTEKLSPDESVRVLNDFLTEMSNVIMQGNGFVDKYMGDSIMAFWNAPLDDPAPAEKACNCALAMVSHMKDFQVRLNKPDMPALSMGVGVSSGPAIVGNMGSRQKFGYSAMGDAVNLGSRLQSLTRLYGVNCIISEETHHIVKEKFLCRLLDKISAKGRRDGTVIYELVTTREAATPQQVARVNEFEDALHFYFSQEFEEAYLRFEQLAKAGDEASKEFLVRSEYYIKNLPVGWDGIWTAKPR